MGLFGAVTEYFPIRRQSAFHSLPGRRLMEQDYISLLNFSRYYCYFLFESGFLVLEDEDLLGRWFSFGLVAE